MSICDASRPATGTSPGRIPFSTADVVITGSRLHLITKLLCAGQLASVRPNPAPRYAEAFPNKPHVADIAVTYINKE